MIERDKQNEKYTQAFTRIWMSDDGKILDEFMRRKCNADKSCICWKDPNPWQTMCEEAKRKVYLDIMWYIDKGYERNDNE